MRGWAAIMVMYYHLLPSFAYVSILPLAFLYSGYSGIIFFFVISGYILMRKFDSPDYKVEGKFSPVKYYLRRIFRIWPLYFIAIPIFMVTLGMPFNLLDLVFMQNYFPSTFFHSPFWTLLIEELFYLILPIWAIAFHRNWRLALVCMVGLNLAYMGYLAFVLNMSTPTLYAYNQFPAYATAFALGSIVARGKNLKINWMAVAVIWLIVSTALASTAEFVVEYAWFTPMIFSFVYFLVLCNLRSSWFFTNKVSQAIGNLTYPLYLMGLPVEDILFSIFGNNLIWIPLTIIGVFASAYLLHRFVERPFIGLGRSIEARIFGSH